MQLAYPPIRAPSVAREQIPVSNPMREFGNWRFVAVGQDDDGELLIREARDACGEANAVAAMPDFPEAAVLADEPPEAIAGVRVLGHRPRGEGELEHLSAHQFIC